MNRQTLFARAALAVRALAVALAALATPANAGDDTDYHFRAFAVEPADRVPFGEGHATVGVVRAHHQHATSHTRSALPMELTLGLPAGFGLVLEAEGGTRFAGEQAPLPGERAERGLAVKYALPAIDGLHLALLASTSRARGEDHSRQGLSLATAVDTQIGNFGAGYSIGRRQPEDASQSHDFGANWFHLRESGWGLGAELRWGRTPDGLAVRNAMAGITYKLIPGVLLDAALGRSSNREDGRFATFGASFFF